MRKIFILLLSILIAFENSIFKAKASTADESQVLTMYDTFLSNSTLSNDLVYFLDDLGVKNDNVVISKGFLLNNSIDCEKVVYFIICDDEVVASYIISNIEGTLSGYLSNLWITDINYLYQNDNNMFDDLQLFYDSKLELTYAVTKRNRINLVSISEYPVKNAGCKQNKSLINASKSPTSYSRSWSTYKSQSSNDLKCFKYCAYNIYKNMGGNSYSWSDFDYIVYFYNTTNVSNYLENFFSYYICYYGINYTNGFLTFSDVSDIIYNVGYIAIMASGYASGSSSQSNHAMVIRGFVNDGTTTSYRIWDPYLNTSGYMDSSTRTFVSLGGITLTWKNGYAYNFSL